MRIFLAVYRISAIDSMVITSCGAQYLPSLGVSNADFQSPKAIHKQILGPV
jgi:hypothetical protein